MPDARVLQGAGTQIDPENIACKPRLTGNKLPFTSYVTYDTKGPLITCNDPVKPMGAAEIAAFELQSKEP